MCGIAGIYRFDGRSVDPELLRRMTDVIAHRGPDDEGHWIQNQIGLGNRRLSIIDLSQKGHQPMSNEEGSIWVTYNGEIYNFKELRSILSSLGHSFRSHTDTEVILHLYEDKDLKFLEHLNGMFAIALWDTTRQRLILARDRLGIKPLFFYQDSEKLLFGSEIKCILQDESIKREIELEALHHYLSFNYMPAPLTMFKGIRQLLPGQYLLVEKDGVSIREYWDLEFRRADLSSESKYREKLDEVLRKAVKGMLVSDVPFGVFLSGGIDSSTIAYYMSQILEQPVKTFSIGFEEESYNELESARAVAKHLGTDHHEQLVRPDDLEELLPKLVGHAEEPLADASMVPVYYVSKMAREHVKMVLCGDGADEILAGYETYTANKIASIYRAIPGFLRRGIVKPLVKALPVSEKKISFDYKAKRFVEGADYSRERAHFSWRMIFSEEAKRALYSDRWAVELNNLDTFEKTYSEYFLQTNARDALDSCLYVDTRFYLPNDMLAKVDRMSMANSLEVRVPFLDEGVVDYLATVPSSLKLKGLSNKKYLLRQVMRDRLPTEILNQKKKGFNIPVGLWLKTKLRSYVLDALSPEELSKIGLFNPITVQSLITDHFENRRDNGYQIWGLLIFALWHKQFIQGGAYES